MEKIALIYDLDETILPVFEDDDVIKTIPGIKILVTSKTNELQKAKLDALDLEADFDEIIMNEAYAENGPGKKEIFAGIATKYQLTTDHVWIIGDNPEGEIAAGNELGMITVLRTNTEKMKITGKPTFTISSFRELKMLVTDMLKINS